MGVSPYEGVHCTIHSTTLMVLDRWTVFSLKNLSFRRIPNFVKFSKAFIGKYINGKQFLLNSIFVSDQQLILFR